MQTAVTVVIAYHSGKGHTRVLAEAVHDGVCATGARAVLIPVDTLTEAQWTELDLADAIVFGAPTYMGSASAVFHRFAEDTLSRWSARAWVGKIAAGFTIAGAMSGDKLHTLNYFTVLAAQHGMHWVNLDLRPGWCNSKGSPAELNRLGIALGAGAQCNTDEGPEAISESDVETARHLGRRVAETTMTFAAGRLAHHAPDPTGPDPRRALDPATRGS